MSSLEENKANLQTFKTQLSQVEIALLGSPNDQELVKLKNDLTELIVLTEELIKSAKGSSGEVEEPVAKPRATSGWAAGDECEAVWSEDGVYYKAVIEEISEDGSTATVVFPEYGNRDIVSVSSLRDRPGVKRTGGLLSAKDAESKGVKRPATVLAESDGDRRARLEAEREAKKRRQQKKKERFMAAEQVGQEVKSKWQDFSSKAGAKAKTGFLSGKPKKSIFATPDSYDGRVGVGTCGIGGKGMTNYTAPDKHLVLKR
eukprot:Colp12_sorted_trinity150504_noHs@10777